MERPSFAQLRQLVEQQMPMHVSPFNASTPSRSLDEAIVVEDGDVTLVPKGYHPCAAVHGYDLYYLNVMAGPQRTWKFYNAPEHEWLLK
jgi:5-deoxy-D-glucuronate isomerase